MSVACVAMKYFWKHFCADAKSKIFPLTFAVSSIPFFTAVGALKSATH
jgi:hypothetical protein